MGAVGRGPGWGQLRDVRLLNRKSDIELQHRLALLEAQHRYTLKKLQQRKDFLLKEHGRVTLLKVCEPKATVHRNMREIAQLKSAGGGTDAGPDAGPPRNAGARLGSSKSLPPDAGSPPMDPPPPPRRAPPSARPLSIRQMRNIAAIDSIAAREQASRERRAREALQRLRDEEMAALRRRVKAFIDALGSAGGDGATSVSLK
ncbi:unnamed protein product [Merluccius merluccius]